jgi:hypothetical protein
MPTYISIIAPRAVDANRIAREHDVSFDLVIKDHSCYYNWEPVEEADGESNEEIIQDIQTQRNKVEIHEVNGHLRWWTIKYEERRTA